jgi:hypothetical protein
LLEDVRLTGEPIDFLKNGKPFAVVYPVPVANRRAAFGDLRSTLASPVGDLVSPLDERAWEGRID